MFTAKMVGAFFYLLFVKIYCIFVKNKAVNINSRIFISRNDRNKTFVSMKPCDIDALALHEFMYAKFNRVNGVIKAPNYKSMASSLGIGSERFKRLLNRMIHLNIAQIDKCDGVRSIRLLSKNNMITLNKYSKKRKHKFIYKKSTVSNMSLNDSVMYMKRFMLMTELERQRYRAYQFVDRNVFNLLSPKSLKEHRRNLRTLRNNSLKKDDATRIDRGLVRTSDKKLSKLFNCSTVTANKIKRYWQKTNMFNLRTLQVIDGCDMSSDIFSTLKDDGIIPKHSHLQNGSCFINIGTLVCCTENNDITLNSSNNDKINKCFIEQAYKLQNSKCNVISNNNNYYNKYNLLIDNIGLTNSYMRNRLVK